MKRNWLWKTVNRLKAQRRVERGNDDPLSIHFDAPSYRVGAGYDNHAEPVHLPSGHANCQCTLSPVRYEGPTRIEWDFSPDDIPIRIDPRIEDDSRFRPAHQTDVFLQCSHCGYVFNEMDLRWWYYYGSGQFCDSCKRRHD